MFAKSESSLVKSSSFGTLQFAFVAPIDPDDLNIFNLLSMNTNSTVDVIDWHCLHPEGIKGVLQFKLVEPLVADPAVQEPTVQGPTVPEPTVQEPALQEPTVQEKEVPPERGQLASDFIDILRRENPGKLKTIDDLELMLNKKPRLVWVNKGDDGTYTLCFERRKIIELVQKASPDFFVEPLVFTSFERGLKHLGLSVSETTHGPSPVKRWYIDNEKIERRKKIIRERKQKKKRDRSPSSIDQEVSDPIPPKWRHISTVPD